MVSRHRRHVSLVEPSNLCPVLELPHLRDFTNLSWFGEVTHCGLEELRSFALVLHVFRLLGRLCQHRTRKGVRDHSPGSPHFFALALWLIAAPCFHDGLFVLLTRLFSICPEKCVLGVVGLPHSESWVVSSSKLSARWRPSSG